MLYVTVSCLTNYNLCLFVCVLGDSVPAHLEREPEQPALLVQPGDGGACAGHHPLQDPGLPEGHPHKQTSAQDQHKLQGGTHTPPIVLLHNFKIQSNLDISNSDISNSAKLEASI